MSVTPNYRGNIVGAIGEALPVCILASVACTMLRTYHVTKLGRGWANKGRHWGPQSQLEGALGTYSEDTTSSEDTASSEVSGQT